MFTDIESSTSRWEEDAGSMGVDLERHDAILRERVVAHNGHVLKSMGDGFMAVFGRATDAARAAVGAQRQLAAEDLPPVRIGLHSGEALERDDDYFGPTVNRAARIMAIGHGGQILISGSTRQLLTDIEVRDMGEHRLRDLTQPERVFQLVDDDLPDDFPALRSLGYLPTNLPVQLTSFVGREREQKELRDLVSHHRLVTITGVGGVGKTRLAVQVGAELVPEFPDGVWLCELAAIDEPEALPQVVAFALGVKPLPGRSVVDAVCEYLRLRHALLIMDNCEHLLDPAADLIEAVLRVSGRSCVLATSREGLNLPGERLWPLGSLQMGVGESSDAGVLFLDRAQAVQPGFALDADTHDRVEQICRRLDGLPLAIELAAARVGALSPLEILELLDQRFRLLTGGRRRTVDRHQTLRSTVDWSYSLLNDLQRTVFERLGVFAGAFDADAAEAVVAGDGVDRFDVIDALTELVAKSMVSVVRDDSAHTRYELLETLRQYAIEKLEGSEAAEVRRRYAAYFAELATRLGAQVLTGDEVAARARVAVELDNLRSAMAWGLDSDDPADRLLAVRIVAPLGSLVSNMRSGGFGAWSERAVEASREAPEGLRFSVLGGASFSAIMRGDMVLAQQLSDEAFALGPPVDAPFRTIAYSARAMVLAIKDLPAASHFLQQSVPELRRMGEQYGAVNLLSVAGIFASLGGDTEAGRALTHAGVEGARDLANPTSLAIALFASALACWRDDPDVARASIEESLRMTEAGASDTVYSDNLELLSRLQRAAGETGPALRTIRSSLRESLSVGNHISVISSLWYVAELLGLVEREAEVGAVLHGVTTRGPDADVMPAILGREADLHEEALTTIRNHLGPQRFDELVHLGSTMDYERAAAYAMTHLDRIIADIESDSGA